MPQVNNPEKGERHQKQKEKLFEARYTQTICLSRQYNTFTEILAMVEHRDPLTNKLFFYREGSMPGMKISSTGGETKNSRQPGSKPGCPPKREELPGSHNYYVYLK